MTHLNRRRFITSVIAIGALGAAIPMPASANEAAATAQVHALFGAMKSALQKGRSARVTAFHNMLRRYGDVPSIAAYALGREGRSLNTAQKREFYSVFGGYMARKYSSKLKDLNLNELHVQNVRTQTRGSRTIYTVEAIITRHGRSSAEVEFDLHHRGGTLLFYNMRIEGISMLLTERRRMGELFDTHRSFNRVIEALSRMS